MSAAVCYCDKYSRPNPDYYGVKIDLPLVLLEFARRSTDNALLRVPTGSDHENARSVKWWELFPERIHYLRI